MRPYPLAVLGRNLSNNVELYRSRFSRPSLSLRARYWPRRDSSSHLAHLAGGSKTGGPSGGDPFQKSLKKRSPAFQDQVMPPTDCPMLYKSTRGGEHSVPFEKALLSAYASDGGLYVPEEIPRLTFEELQSWAPLSTAQVCARVMANACCRHAPRSLTRVHWSRQPGDGVLPVRCERRRHQRSCRDVPKVASAAGSRWRCAAGALQRRRAASHILVRWTADASVLRYAAAQGRAGALVASHAPGVGLLAKAQITGLLGWRR